jgi:hypothetical protein
MQQAVHAVLPECGIRTPDSGPFPANTTIEYIIRAG